MNEDKVRKAIEVIKGYRRLDELMHNMDRLQYCDIAIEALEKQLVLKPLREDTKECRDYKCPSCRRTLLSIYLDREAFGERKETCDCGQKLDWSK